MVFTKTTLPHSLIASAETRLRSAGMRVTQARVNVMAHLLVSDEALSHGELQAALPGTDRVTLYRALDALVEADLVHKIALNDRAFRYGVGPRDFKSGDHDHQHGHFKCTGCGKVFCLTATTKKRTMLDQLQKSLKQTMAPGFQSHGFELTIKGWCADCAR